MKKKETYFFKFIILYMHLFGVEKECAFFQIHAKFFMQIQIRNLICKKICLLKNFKYIWVLNSQK